MTRTLRLALRSSYAAGVLGALAFGAIQATPTPAKAAPQCEPSSCDQYCRNIGADFGWCGSYFEGCVCEYL